MPRKEENGGEEGKAYIAAALRAQEEFAEVAVPYAAKKEAFYAAVRRAHSRGEGKISQAVLARLLNLSRPRVAQIVDASLSGRQFARVKAKRRLEHGFAIVAGKMGVREQEALAAIEQEPGKRRGNGRP